MTQLSHKWHHKHNKTIRPIQLAFEFNQTVSKVIKDQANKRGISPSDQIRAILGLQPKQPKRPRLTVSLSELDYEMLAKRYGLSVDDQIGIRKAIAGELIAYSESICELD